MKPTEMKKILYIILFAYSGLLMAQNKTITTIHGERIRHDIRISTTDRDALQNKSVGILIFNLTTKCHESYDGVGWYNYCWGGYTKPVEASTGGSAIVSVYNCDTNAMGTMTQGVPVNGVTQTITAVVETAGTYNITAAANGVTFNDSGSFAGTGAHEIQLTAAGTPLVLGISNFLINTSVACTFSRTINAPVSLAITAQPVAPAALCAVNPDDPAAVRTISVQTTGATSYQWKKNGANLSDDDKVTGTASNVLTFSNPGVEYSGNYRVEVSDGATTLLSDEVVFVVHPLPLLVSSGASVKYNEGEVDLQVVGEPGTTVKWYEADSNTFVHQGESYRTPYLYQTEAYYADIIGINGCITRHYIDAVINQIPNGGSEQMRVCPGEITTITTYTPYTTRFQWLRNGEEITDDNVLSGTTTKTLTFNNPDSSYSGDYNLVSKEGNAIDISHNLNVAINDIHVLTDVIEGSRTGPGAVTLTATTDVGYVVWYASETNPDENEEEIPLYVGESFTTPEISATTTYWVVALPHLEWYGCSAPRTSVVATVN